MFRQLLRTSGYTQVELARKLGVTQALISKWVTGRGTPKTVTISKIAEVFGVSVDEVIACFKIEE